MSCLILVDIQNDFLPSGALAVKDGDAIIPVANALQKHFDLVVATRDWHPADHGSFASVHNKPVGAVIELQGLPQVLWPVHCVQDTFGAQFPTALHQEAFDKIIDKGIDRNIDSYGAFFDNGQLRETELEEYLRKKKVQHLFVMGLTTDYCVKYTVLDALELGFYVTVIRDGCRAVDLQPTDGQEAFEEMEAGGALLIESKDLLTR